MSRKPTALAVVRQFQSETDAIREAPEPRGTRIDCVCARRLVGERCRDHGSDQGRPDHRQRRVARSFPPSWSMFFSRSRYPSSEALMFAKASRFKPDRCWQPWIRPLPPPTSSSCGSRSRALRLRSCGSRRSWRDSPWFIRKARILISPTMRHCKRHSMISASDNIRRRSTASTPRSNRPTRPSKSFRATRGAISSARRSRRTSRPCGRRSLRAAAAQSSICWYPKMHAWKCCALSRALITVSSKPSRRWPQREPIARRSSSSGLLS